MTGKEMVKSVSLSTPPGMTITKLLETYDTTSTAKFNLMEKTALKIRHLVEAMDEEVISFHEQKGQNLVIETGQKGIERAKRNYNDTTLRQNALREIEIFLLLLFTYKSKTSTWKISQQKHRFVYKLYGFCCSTKINKK
jgi:hypothetical protein